MLKPEPVGVVMFFFSFFTVVHSIRNQDLADCMWGHEVIRSFCRPLRLIDCAHWGMIVLDADAKVWRDGLVWSREKRMRKSGTIALVVFQ